MSQEIYFTETFLGSSLSTHSAERPAGAALPLVLDGSHVTLGPPVDRVGNRELNQRRHVCAPNDDRLVALAHLVAVHRRHEFAMLLKSLRQK